MQDAPEVCTVGHGIDLDLPFRTPVWIAEKYAALPWMRSRPGRITVDIT